MTPTTDEIKKLAAAWIKYHEIILDSAKNTREFRKAIEMGTHPLSNARDKVAEYIRTFLEVGWQLILEMLMLTQSEEIIANIAAGPLEDLIDYHADLVIDRIEKQSRIDDKFRQCLTGVWPSSRVPADILRRIQAAL